MLAVTGIVSIKKTGVYRSNVKMGKSHVVLTFSTIYERNKIAFNASVANQVVNNDQFGMESLLWH